MKKGGNKKVVKRIKVWQLVLALFVVVFGAVIFVGAVAGWFGSAKIVLDDEYYVSDPEMIDIGIDEYNDLISQNKSFVVFVDQSGCTTADRLREYMMQYMEEKGILVYGMTFSDVKESSLHDFVKYYPSVVLVSKGRPVVWLRADSDEDAEKYNNYDVLKEWLNLYL